MRRTARCAALACLATLAACRAPAPETAGEPAPWRHPELPGLTFMRPVNWTVELVGAQGAALVVVTATEAEKLVITHRRDSTALPLDEFCRRVESEVAERFPTARATAPRDTALGGRPARLVEVTLPDTGQVGRRYVVNGGWIVEVVARAEQVARVEPGFDLILDSLDFAAGDATGG